VMRLMVVVSCVISVALLSRCGGGSSQQSVQRLTIAPAALPNGTSETPYSQTIQASGGVAPFTWTVSAGALPNNVALSSSTTDTVTISGTPDTAVQGLAFTVKVTDSASQAATQPYTVSILLEPDTLTLSPASLSFAQLVGTSSGAQAEVITNTGTSAVVISSIALIGNPAEFGQSNSCGSSLAAGLSCIIYVTFTPTQLGPMIAAIMITDNTVGSPHNVPLSGVGLTSGPNATLSAGNLGFATQHVGTTSPAHGITLTNYGSTVLNITSIAATANFGESDNCGSSLASGANCIINVTFTPSASGSLNGTLSITDNDPGSPQTVALSGTGTTTNYTLTGDCFYAVDPAGLQCTETQEPTLCPPGQPANTTSVTSCGSGVSARVDSSRRCSGGTGGRCVAQ
jgi:hypothetical protein